ncbi:Zinc finger, RING-CH-type,Zinc finger, RING/FYVE/PHD-type [Cinara cedri]|uniref:Zinc finger, RING-CH-type,Zinc finger, RING/FYVE/PHD-type n=1 Tax=Cinara cedri TaxID=506608 RepID=A0A5E4M8V5_9HEMI|nr:Zinc finger, RING-CH-type,Zinc finger, RING/FYVE/PHD-type [Cinara cedri]
MTTLQVHQPELTVPAETTLPADTTEETCAIEKKPSAVFCKICLSGGSDEQLLIQPCTCKGSMGHVHLSCLERWLNENGVGRCELCHFEFNVEERLRYTAGRALLIWSRSPNHRDSLRIDFTVILIMTLIVGILLTCVSTGHDAISEITG